MSNLIRISTTLGDITVRLYDETPIHRDNFLKLVREGYLNGTLFHRVISNFMIQGGDPDSRGASPSAHLGVGGPDYTLQAEINPDLIHKRGALAAARQGDEVNPERRSSGSQFYICWGQIYKEGQIKQLDLQLKQQAEQQTFNRLVQENRGKIMEMRKKRDREGLMELQNEILAETHALLASRPTIGLSELQRKTYTTIGGVPHLDGQYTVFGEVVEGLDVVEKIQSVKTGQGDRPIDDIAMTLSEI